MTPEENRRRIARLRSEEIKPKDSRKLPRQKFHNSAEILFIQKMSQGGKPPRKLLRSPSGRVS